MKELNELFESAKETAAIYGAEWDNALSKYPDGVVQFEVVSTEGETVVTTGRFYKSDSWLCDYLVHCSPANILAIAEAFRALERERNDYRNKFLDTEQRAEAAEAESAKWKEEAIKAHEESEIILAKLAELEKQEAFGFCNEDAKSEHTVSARLWRTKKDAEHGSYGLSVFPLFTRPAPAINLAELVPPEADGSNLPFAANGWNACRAEILRKIEEEK